MSIRALRKSAGVALVTAIFLLVVLAGLAVAVVSLMTSQQAGVAQDEQGTRAYQAAKAGIEWALFTQLQGATLGCASTTSFALPPGTSLSAFTVTVSCGAAGGLTPNRFEIRAVACNQPAGNACPNGAPGPDYVQREIRAQL
ncbi:agglutinin biogenesis protein MshP [Duganella sp. CT11-25]|uniref:agglutinin biogenesis protein MshP n=1 Tax=unclassified Duganella TaxID=2636909 RepID=UPI0039B02495